MQLITGTIYSNDRKANFYPVHINFMLSIWLYAVELSPYYIVSFLVSESKKKKKKG